MYCLVTMKDNVFLEQNCKKTSSYLYILLFVIKYNKHCNLNIFSGDSFGF